MTGADEDPLRAQRPPDADRTLGLDEAVLVAEVGARAALEQVFADVSWGIPRRTPMCDAFHRNRLVLVPAEHETVRSLRSGCVRVAP